MIRLRDLYYDRATPLTHVANAFSIPVSTLLRWIAEMDWPRRSSQVGAVNPRVNLYAQVEAELQTAPRRRGKAKPVDRYELAAEVGAAARAELAALAREAGPKSFEDRRRRAAVIDQLCRAVTRMERVEQQRFEAIDQMNKAVGALMKTLTPKKPPPPPGPKIRAAPYDRSW